MSKLNDADLILNLQMSILKKLDAEDYVTSIEREGDSLLIVTKNNNVTKVELPKGEKGEKGDDGRRGGRDGKDGVDGQDGKDGAPGADGKDGKDGKNGLPGADGKDGKDGKDGNGIIDIKIDQRGHLIIITRDKTYDLGRIRSGSGGTVIKTQDFFYTNSTPMPYTIGGFPAGTTFNNIPLNEMWTRLLYPDSPPTLLYRIFVGESPLPTLTENDVESLRINELKETIDGEYELLGGGYKWFCYPVSMGTRDNFYDVDTDFQIAMSAPQTITITDEHGVSTQYYCYRTYNVLNGAITIGIAE